MTNPTPKAYPRTTFWLLRIEQTLLLLGLIAVVYFAVSGAAKNVFALGAVGFLLLTLMLVVGWIGQGLSSGTKGGWNASIALSFLSIPTPLLPLAAFALYELFDRALRDRFFSLRRHGQGELSDEERLVYLGSRPARKKSSAVGRLALIAVSLGGVALFSVLAWQGSGRVLRSVYRIDPSWSIRQLQELGATCNTQGRDECSRAVYARVLELQPFNRSALANLAIAETRLGDYDTAVKRFELYFARGGEGVDAMAYYGDGLRATGQSREALRWYSSALKAEPRLLDVVYKMISLLEDLGRPEEALALLEHFVDSNPSAKQTLNPKRAGLEKKVAPENRRDPRAI